jgi:hypothetical protein
LTLQSRDIPDTFDRLSGVDEEDVWSGAEGMAVDGAERQVTEVRRANCVQSSPTFSTRA